MSLLIDGRAIMCIKFCLPDLSIGKQGDAQLIYFDILIDRSAELGPCNVKSSTDSLFLTFPNCVGIGNGMK